MSSKDIAEAMAYERIEPFGDTRADYRMALQTAYMAQFQGVKKRGGGQFSPADFMPKFGEKKPTVSDKIKEVFGKWRH